MAYQTVGALEQASLSRPSFTLQSAYSLGRFYESKKKPNFMPVVEAGQLERWIEAHDGKDPIKEFPWPRDLVNVWSLAQKHAVRGGLKAVQIRFTEESPATAGQQACMKVGYTPYEVYGDRDAAQHLKNFIAVVKDSRIDESLPPSKRRGATSLGSNLEEERKKWNF